MTCSTRVRGDKGVEERRAGATQKTSMGIGWTTEGRLLVKRYTKLLATVAVLGIVAAACGGGGGNNTTTPGQTTSGGTPPPTTTASLPTGGTMKIAAPADIAGGWDPAKEYEALAFEFYRCCLTRTLMSFDGTALEVRTVTTLARTCTKPPSMK